MEDLPETKKSRLGADFSLDHTGGWGGGRMNQNDNYWKLKSYKGTNLGYDMLCESVNSDQEVKEGYLLNGNHIINLNNYSYYIVFHWLLISRTNTTLCNVRI